MHWRERQRRAVFEHPLLSLHRVSRSQGEGPAHEFLVLDCPDWVNVIPITPQGEVILIRQWRQGIAASSLEIPGGMVDPGETPAQAAARELCEETGYEPGRLEELGWVHPNPALFNNRCHSFLARDAIRVAEPRLEETEQIEVVKRPLAELARQVRDGGITHALVLAALCLYLLEPKRAELAKPPALGPK